MKNVTLAGAVVLAMAATPALAQKATGTKMMSDEHFVTDVLNVGMAEVELGKMAADKASREEVKKFGQRMADDHSKAGDELKTLAQKKNITPPTELDAKHKALRDRLMKLSGEGFDHAYMQAMVSGHRQAVNAFRMESKSGKDPEIKEWAATTLPTIEDHLKQAQELSHGAVGTSGTMKHRTKK
jgi:putative membrane protein